MIKEKRKVAELGRQLLKMIEDDSDLLDFELFIDSKIKEVEAKKRFRKDCFYPALLGLDNKVVVEFRGEFNEGMPIFWFDDQNFSVESFDWIGEALPENLWETGE